jgi:membrane-associated phospholipid phosphatase
MRMNPSSGLTLAKLRASGLMRPAFALPAILAIAAAFGLCLDGSAGAMAGKWPWLLHRPSRLLTDYGKSGWILWSSAIVFLFGALSARMSDGGSLRRYGRRAMSSAGYIFSSVAASGIAANIIKTSIGRARPDLYSSTGAFSLKPFAGHYYYQSFPSGHGTTAGAFFIALAILFPRHWLLFLILGIALASMRVFVGAHYPSDATAGFLLGAWFSFVTAWWFQDKGLWIEKP